MNAAFSGQKKRDKKEDFLPSTRPRLASEDQLLTELRSAHGAFTFVLYYNDTNEVFATVGAKEYLPARTVFDINDPSYKLEVNTWKRFDPLPDSAVAWTLSMMAVEPKLQGQGLAAQLMWMAEDEVRSRFEQRYGKESGKKLYMTCSTAKEVNGPFYEKRGYKISYEMSFPPGHFDSVRGFTVVHMLKPLSETQR